MPGRTTNNKCKRGSEGGYAEYVRSLLDHKVSLKTRFTTAASGHAVGSWVAAGRCRLEPEWPPGAVRPKVP